MARIELSKGPGSAPSLNFGGLAQASGGVARAVASTADNIGGQFAVKVAQQRAEEKRLLAKKDAADKHLARTEARNSMLEAAASTVAGFTEEQRADPEFVREALNTALPTTGDPGVDVDRSNVITDRTLTAIGASVRATTAKRKIANEDFSHLTRAGVVAEPSTFLGGLVTLTEQGQRRIDAGEIRERVTADVVGQKVELVSGAITSALTAGDVALAEAIASNAEAKAALSHDPDELLRVNKRLEVAKIRATAAAERETQATYQTTMNAATEDLKSVGQGTGPIRGAPSNAQLLAAAEATGDPTKFEAARNVVWMRTLAVAAQTDTQHALYGTPAEVAATGEELEASFSAVKDSPAGAQSRRQAQARLELFNENIAKRVKAVKADPAAYVHSGIPGMAAREGVLFTPGTGRDVADSYLTDLNAEYDRLGVPLQDRRVLTGEASSKLDASIDVAFKAGSATPVLEALGALHANVGPKVYSQIVAQSEELPAEVRTLHTLSPLYQTLVVEGMVDRTALNIQVESLDETIKIADFDKLAKVAAGEANSSIAHGFTSGLPKALKDSTQSISTLAKVLFAKSTVSTPEEATERAVEMYSQGFTSVIEDVSAGGALPRKAGSKHVLRPSAFTTDLRVPTNVAPAALVDDLSVISADLGTAFPGVPVLQSGDMDERIRSNGLHFKNTFDGRILMLVGDGPNALPLQDADGTLVTFPPEEAQALADSVRGGGRPKPKGIEFEPSVAAGAISEVIDFLNLGGE